MYQNGLKLLYPKLNEDNHNIIEKSLYLDSKKNNFIQMADVCALYCNKYRCIKQNYHTYNEIKTNHCINMFKKINAKSKFPVKNIIKHSPNTIDNLFKQNVQGPLE